MPKPSTQPPVHLDMMAFGGVGSGPGHSLVLPCSVDGAVGQMHAGVLHIHNQ